MPRTDHDDEKDENHKPAANADVEPSSEQQPDSGLPYSIFTPFEKKCIILTAAVGSVFSPLSTTIYLPALNILADDLHVSDAKINLTVTTYLILQGIAPALIAGFSDTAGRRPAYIICFTIYIAANIGLAFQRSYPALLVLRSLQSAGSSGTIALVQGVVADTVPSAERGTYVGFTTLPSILSPIVGPILGGVLAEYGGWRWIFYFLIIFSLVFFVPFLLFFPETCRKAVADGSVPPPKLNVCLTTVIKERRRMKVGVQIDPSQAAEVKKNYKLSVPNPLSTLEIAVEKESALILISSAIIFSYLYAVNTGIPSQFGRIYSFNELRIGMCYIPIGAGAVLSAFTTGKMVDHSWKRHAKKAGFPVVKNRDQDLTYFPVEKARLEVSLPVMYFASAAIITYGWVLYYQTHLAIPLVVLFCCGYGIMAGFQITQILMVDICPGRAAAATAANNLFRCLLGAGTTAVLAPMFTAMQVGWTYTFAALLWVAISPLLLWLMKAGPWWRQAQKAQEDGENAKTSASGGSAKGAEISSERRRSETAEVVQEVPMTGKTIVVKNRERNEG